jgi:hypothetical protein
MPNPSSCKKTGSLEGSIGTRALPVHGASGDEKASLIRHPEPEEGLGSSGTTHLKQLPPPQIGSGMEVVE